MQRTVTNRYILILAAACAIALSGQAVSHAAEQGEETDMQKPTEPIVDVFIQGDGGYPQIRIPAIVTTRNGVLLAFAEGRQAGDHSENDIIVKRSTDSGKTWGPVQVISEMGGDSLNDPCAVALKSGRVLLLFQRYPKGYHTGKSSHTEMADLGYDGPTNTQSFLTCSDDDGVTWSEPEDVTRALRREDVVSVGSPGIGIELQFGEHKGRIVWPLYEVMPVGGGDRFWHNRAAFSDDGGLTWKLGERVPLDKPEDCSNEAQIVELADGRILMNSRGITAKPCRMVSVSHDGGGTWETMREDCGLMAPQCMGSIIGCINPGDGKQIVLVSLPNTTSERRNGTIFISKDGGQTWPIKRMIYPEYFGYSCLTVLPDGRVGCLYEREGTARTSLGLYDLNWLMGDTL